MYANRKHVRAEEVKVRFNEEEIEVINTLANYARKQRATWIYEKVMEQIKLEAQINQMAD